MEYSDQDLCDLIYRSRLGKLDANEQKQLDAWLEYPENRELYHRIWNREIILGKMMRMEGYNRTAAWEQVFRKEKNFPQVVCLCCCSSTSAIHSRRTLSAV